VEPGAGRVMSTGLVTPTLDAGDTYDYVLIADGDARAAAEAQSTVAGLGLQTSVTSSVAEAVAGAAELPPQLLIAEVDLGGKGLGFHLAETCRTRWGTPVVLTCGRIEACSVAAIAAFDPHGFVCKPLNRRQLETTVRLALARADRRYAVQRTRRDESARHNAFEQALRQISLIINQTGFPAPAEGAVQIDELTRAFRPREREIVMLLLQHERVPHIARRLGISQATVRNHLKRVFAQTGARSQQELLARFQRPDRPAGSAT
jgi:DNA-binding NarL/FixJ family response regulator